MIIRMHAIGFILTLLAALATCQTLEDGWSGIKPLKTDKTEVEKKLGTPKSDENGYYYDLGNRTVIRLNYSTNPCTPDQYNRGKYRIPKDTVLDYVVYFNNTMLLSDLHFNGAEYTKQDGGHVGNEFVLLNEKTGIMIVGEYRPDTRRDEVGTIYFRPSSPLKEKLLCKS